MSDGHKRPRSPSPAQLRYGKLQKQIGRRYQAQKNQPGALGYNAFVQSEEIRNLKSVSLLRPRFLNDPKFAPSSASSSADTDYRASDPPAPAEDIVSPGRRRSGSVDSYSDLLAMLGPGSQTSSMDAGPSGGRGASASGASVGVSPLIALPKSRDADGWSMSFQKSRVMISYAYANAQLDQQTLINHTDGFCTPLSYIPVDFVYLFICLRLSLKIFKIIVLSLMCGVKLKLLVYVLLLIPGPLLLLLLLLSIVLFC